MSAYDNRAYGYSIFRDRRGKTDWAGVGIGDAFKPGLDYFVRMPAQRLFYRAVRKAQRLAARLAEGASEAPAELKVLPQLSPFYTTYPSTLAAHAAIGLSAFLEFEQRSQDRAILKRLEGCLDKPAEHGQVAVDPVAYKQVAQSAARFVQVRILLVELSRTPALAAIESYRLFLASQQTLRFHTLPEILQTVIVFGDLLPDWRRLDVHPMTRALLECVTAISAPYLYALPDAEPHMLSAYGADWVRHLCNALAKFLPPPVPEDKQLPVPNQPPCGIDLEMDDDDEVTNEYRFGHPDEAQPPEGDDDRVPPLDGKRPPSLFDPSNLLEQLHQACREPGNDPDQLPGKDSTRPSLQQVLQALAQAIDGAAGQEGTWQDMRSDLVEQAVRTAGFGAGPIQGTAAEGHEVQVEMDGKLAGGELHDRALELSDDVRKYDALLAESAPVTAALRRALYPSVEQLPETERFRTSGALDGSRLAIGDVTAAVFRRYRIHERADVRGRPVLLIACDGSGSLGANEMRMTKVLAASWLNSTVRTGVRVLAGLYTSGHVRKGVTGPLVQWMLHEQKTPATSRKDAARALCSLPEAGTGAQSDAISIKFMLEEAKRVARGATVYLILISDCAWNKSFQGPRTGVEEVRATLAGARADFGSKLHVTLVAVGRDRVEGLEGLIDKEIPVPKTQLGDYAGVASRIGTYVAGCMRERQKLVSRRG